MARIAFGQPSPDDRLIGPRLGGRGRVQLVLDTFLSCPAGRDTERKSCSVPRTDPERAASHIRSRTSCSVRRCRTFRTLHYLTQPSQLLRSMCHKRRKIAVPASVSDRRSRGVQFPLSLHAGRNLDQFPTTHGTPLLDESKSSSRPSSSRGASTSMSPLLRVRPSRTLTLSLRLIARPHYETQWT